MRSVIEGATRSPMKQTLDCLGTWSFTLVQQFGHGWGGKGEEGRVGSEY